MMRAPWKQLVLSRLADGADPEGGFAYRPSHPPGPEPTSLAALALSAHDAGPLLVGRSLAALGRWQTGEGAIPVAPHAPAASWPTALAALAWKIAGPFDDHRYRRNVGRALAYLLRNEGSVFRSDPRVYGHDTQLVGWPWVENTHTWLEPTAYALLALRATGRTGHPRAAQAVRTIYDRAIPSGGWNYGNARMFDNHLRPFPSTTGMVLAALAGRERDAVIDQAIAYLRRELRELGSMFSLGWGIVGLRCWDAVPRQGWSWLDQAVSRNRPGGASALEDAIMLIAIADVSPFTVKAPGGRPSHDLQGSSRA